MWLYAASLSLLACLVKAEGSGLRAPSLYVSGETAIHMSHSAFSGFVIGCFSLGVIFSILFVRFWKHKFRRERPPSLFVAKERWSKNGESKLEQKELPGSSYCAIM